MLPHAEDIRYFLAVAETLNISRAAERLGIRQPSVSLSIQRLEQSTGALLLVRRKTGVQLTQAGQRVAAQSRELLAEWEQIRNAAIASERQVSGRYSFGCHPSVALYSLPGFIRKLTSAHPALELDFIHGLSRAMTEEVVSFRVDFGIVVNPVRHPDLVIQELCRDRMTLWQAPGARQDTLIVEPDLLQSQTLLKQLDKKKIIFPHIMRSSNLEVIASLASEGCGVAILPERVAARSPRRLKLFHRDAPVFEDRICLVYRADAQKTQAGRAIIDAIRRAKI